MLPVSAFARPLVGLAAAAQEESHDCLCSEIYSPFGASMLAQGSTLSWVGSCTP